jgi:hypothetical protein
MLAQQLLEIGLAHHQQRGRAMGVGVVRARQAVEERDVAEPGAGFGIGQRDLLARQRNRADAHRAQRHAAPFLRRCVPREASASPSRSRRTAARVRIALFSVDESLLNHAPVSMFCRRL